MEKIEIRIGIKTSGKPILERSGNFTLLKNMLIGDGFHWESSIAALLPGEIKNVNHITLPPNDSTDINKRDCGKNVDRNITLINIVPLEEYLECVVGSEMNPQAPKEFLKAHAVISRNWALGKIKGHHCIDNKGKFDENSRLIGWDDTSQHNGFHVCSDDHCQRYQGWQNISTENKEAIQTTAGQVLLDQQGNLLDTRFSKCCGGETEIFSTCWQDIDFSYLQNIKDPWCDMKSLSSPLQRRLLSSCLKDYDLSTPNYGAGWHHEIKKTDIKKNLKMRFGRDVGEILGIKILNRGKSGRVNLIEIVGTLGTLKLGKELWIRRLLSSSCLYSSAFEIKDCGEDLSITGRGWGHGVGLCQIGAANMAINGYDFKQILSFYYPGSILSKI